MGKVIICYISKEIGHIGYRRKVGMADFVMLTFGSFIFLEWS